jgi:hypothetical protein
MQVSFEELGEGLLGSGFQKVIFLEVECNVHGAYRLGVREDQAPAERFECPECHALRPCSGIIATGYSRKPLPLKERWCGPGNWKFQAKEELAAQEHRARLTKRKSAN